MDLEPTHLLNTTTLNFEPPLDISANDQAPRNGSKRAYAILSHRWSPKNDDEVSYEDIMAGRARQKPGFSKLEGTARQARKDGYDWIWIDTCCIDKRSSAELTESINSMYRWYEQAGRCYAYLQDITAASNKPWHDSEWFERGWTLQELIAPAIVDFFDCDWKPLKSSSSKKRLADEISHHTGIHAEVLMKSRSIQDFSIAQKMSWVAKRRTSRPEDMAYCLLGIFDVNMVPMYGEGEKAFIRLQEEIIKHSDDHSIFAWSIEAMAPAGCSSSGLLAPHPRCFKQSSEIDKFDGRLQVSKPFSVTNKGLSIDLEITPWAVDTYLAFIDCTENNAPDEGTKRTKVRLGIFVRRLPHHDQYARINLSRDRGLFLDKDDVYGKCFEDRDGYRRRPLRRQQLFVPLLFLPPLAFDVRTTGNGGHRIWLKDYGNSIGNIPFRCDAPCELTIYNLNQCRWLGQIAVGFDFDFNPVCLLTDADAPRYLTGPVITNEDDEVVGRQTYQVIEGQRYMEVAEGSAVYRRAIGPQLHDGIWRLRCHRWRELDNVALMYDPTSAGPHISMRRWPDDHLVWEIELKHING